MILDLTIPGSIGGREILEELRRWDPSVLAIASSGYANDPVMAEHLKHGFCAVIPKPYKLEDLALSVSEALHPSGRAPAAGCRLESRPAG